MNQQANGASHLDKLSCGIKKKNNLIVPLHFIFILWHLDTFRFNFFVQVFFIIFCNEEKEVVWLTPQKGHSNKLFTPKHQYAYSPYCSLYIS